MVFQTDVNDAGPIGTDFLGGSAPYPDGNWTTRDAVIDEHIQCVVEMMRGRERQIEWDRTGGGRERGRRKGVLGLLCLCLQLCLKEGTKLYDEPPHDYSTLRRCQLFVFNYDQHIRYTRGLLRFWREDPSVPMETRANMSTWGLCADEWMATEGWPSQLCVAAALFLAPRDCAYFAISRT